MLERFLRFFRIASSVQAKPKGAAASGQRLEVDAQQRAGGIACRMRGNSFLQGGKLSEAAESYRQAIALNPRDIDACTNLGFVLCEMKRFDDAAIALRQATVIDPNGCDALYMLGTLSEVKGDFAEAIAHFSRALELKPDFDICRRDLCRALFRCGNVAEAAATIERGLSRNPQVADFHFYRGNLNTHQGDFTAAAADFRMALSIQPNHAEALFGLGNTYERLGDDEAASGFYQKAIQYNPEFFQAHFNLGLLYQRRWHTEAAITCFRRALTLQPTNAQVRNNLGELLRGLGKFDEAKMLLEQAISANQNFAEAHNNLGSVFLEQGLLGAAIEHFQTAIALRPDLAEAHSNLADAFQAEGELDAAINGYRQALLHKPDFANAFANLLFALNYHPDTTAEDLFGTYQAYDKLFCVPLRNTWRPHTNSRVSGRRLKVGYVSPDFRMHSARHFIEPLLANHNKTNVEVFAYAELKAEDEITARCRNYVDHWIPTLGLGDDQLGERIRTDGIDILVDLAGHTAGSRLRMFARKPAPVSVSWLGYGYTTGLTAIDYFLTDEASAPNGSENLFSEALWRLATPCFAYRPAEDMGPVSPLPAAMRGHVTFGTLTRAVRINHRTIRVWSELLKQVAGARLVVDSRTYRDKALCDALAAAFARHGIERERLELGCHSPPWDVLRKIDIGLDCFPHNSGTTLFETLYMGVPFVTLAGRPSTGRLGSSILEGIGHPEWIARTEEEYIDKLVTLSTDLGNLASARATLRTEMENSPLMDEAGFARRVEVAYREMWRRWCEAKR